MMNTFDRVYETLPADGWLSKREAALLWRCALVTRGPILEVGSYKGRSTVLLASFGKPVHCVDPFDGFSDSASGDEVERQFKNNLAERHIENVQHWRQKIEQWQPPLSTYGLCYLDGDHTYEGTISQIQLALTLRPSLIAIHDVNDRGGGLAVKSAALGSLKRRWDERVERLAIWKIICE